MDAMEVLDVGVRVRLVGQGHAIYHVSALEEHDGITFYRLREFKHALFLSSSLEIVHEHKSNFRRTQ